MPALGQGQYLVFDIASEQCAAPIADVREILMMAQLSTTPGLSDVQAGILNLGGEAIPVLRLNRLLKLPDEDTGLYSHILLTRKSERTIGFQTQSVRKILSYPDQELLPISRETQFRDHALGMLMDGSRFVAVLSLASLVKAFENQSGAA